MLRRAEPRRLLRVERLDDRTLPSANWWSVGTGPGVPAVARMLDASGAERFHVSPFGDSFTGGVVTAVGDLNGDGVPDLITAVDSGGGPRVVVYDGSTGQPFAGPLGSFFAFDPSFTGGVSVAAADLNRAGYDDLIVAAGPGGGPHVEVFDGKTGATRASFYAYAPDFTGGVNVSAADLIGDQRAEIITGAGSGGGPAIGVFGADGTTQTRFYAYDPSFRGGVRVAAGDLTGDSVAEIVTGAGDGGSPNVRTFDGRTDQLLGSFMAGASDSRAGVDVGVRFLDQTPAGLICATVGDTVQDYDGETFAASGAGITVGSGASVGGSCVESGDVIQAWAATLTQALWQTGTPPPQASRALAMFGVSVYDAVNSITRQGKPYRTSVPAPADASPDAAAAAAAAVTLEGLFPSLASQFQAQLAAELASLPDGQGKTDGTAVGTTVAQSVLAWRANDGSSSTVPYTPGTAPGQYELTPPQYKPALDPQWPQVTPFAMTSGSQFRPDPPPAVGSPEYAAALAEVQAIGGTVSSTRTADQTEIAAFWADQTGSSATPPGHWFEIALQVSKERGFSLEQNARLFGMLGVALADAAIVSWDAKYYYDYWRPVTAIQQSDPSWTPLWVTPNFPSYTSGHSSFSGAAAEVLTAIFGRDVPFTSSSDAFPGMVRSFSNFQQAADEAGQSRVYGGIHFQFDNQAGLSSGRALGQYVVANFFTPAP